MNNNWVLVPDSDLSSPQSPDFVNVDASDPSSLQSLPFQVNTDSEPPEVRGDYWEPPAQTSISTNRRARSDSQSRAVSFRAGGEQGWKEYAEHWRKVGE